jgi:hypothetical protein
MLYIIKELNEDWYIYSSDYNKLVARGTLFIFNLQNKIDCYINYVDILTHNISTDFFFYYYSYRVWSF